MVNYNIYTIGWICAIQAELVAASELLDEEIFETVPTPKEDNNAYTLGKIGNHHVVIAALPMGQYGIVNAASVARDMVRTFPNVRLGFMVGIGGGVPTKHDICLGDIVVGVPKKRSGGIVQYDHGRAIQGNGIGIMGTLNQPPTSILTAIAKLDAWHVRKGCKLKETVDNLLEQNNKLVEAGYGRPPKDTDRLYKPEFVHPLGATSCLTACPESNLVMREPRKNDQDSPKIHYGIIASGSQLMEDAIARDRLAENESVLCFEMEAAGLANHFPCIAIRGICDYSDSHRGDDWQGYAALMAAAYAKELLLLIPPEKVEEEKKIKDIIFELHEPIFETKEQVGAIYRSKETEEETKMLHWLQASDYTAEQQSSFQQHQPGTGQQFTSSKEFGRWLQTKNTMLFCSGMPGAGKTIITAITVAYLQARFKDDHGIGVAYVYCNYQPTKKQKIQDLFTSILKQLAQLQRPFPNALKSLYQEKGNGTEKPSADDINKTLRDVINSFDQVFIMVDAIDEFEATETLFSELSSLQEHTLANIFVTSRPPAQSLENALNKRRWCIRKDIQADDHDVKLYIDQRMTEMLFLSEANDEIPGTIKEDLKKQIRKRVSEVVNGIFLLARFHLHGLMGKTRPADVEDALRHLVTGPNAYKDAYEKTIQRIANQPEDHKDLARRALIWLTLAKERLTKLQLRTALSIRKGISQLSDRDFESTNVILHVCMGLVKIEQGGRDSAISLLHFTTMEYLQANFLSLLALEPPHQRMKISSVLLPEVERKRKRLATPSLPLPDIERERKAKRHYEGWIAASCVTYLQFTAFGSGQCKFKDSSHYDFERRQLIDSGFHRRLLDYPLYPYAAKNWAHHAHKTETRSEVLDFLKSEPHASASSQLVPAFRSGPADLRKPNSESGRLGRVTGLHLAAYFGLHMEAACLLSNGMEPDVRDGWGRTPLSYASEEGHAAVVTQLLNYQADLESRSDDDGQDSPRTALSHAARQGHAEVVTILLKEGRVNPDSTPSKSDGGINRTPLSYAAGAGHIDIAKLLLETNEVDAESRDASGLTKRGRTPLSYAAEGGHKALVELLLAIKGVDPDSKDISNRSPLSFAARSGYEIVVDLLLSTKQVDPDSKDNSDMTPLCHAAAAGHGSVVKRLLSINQVRSDPLVDDSRRRQDPNTGETPSLDDMTMLLLANGRVDPNAKDSGGWTPLFHAAINGHEATVDILLAQEDINVNAQDNCGRTVLSNAIRHFRTTAKRLLSHEGLHPDSSDNEGRTPLSHAAESCDIEMIELLLRDGRVKPDTRDTSGRTPLSYAAGRHCSDVAVNLLLNDVRVDPDSKDASGRTPLSYAAGHWNDVAVNLLLNDGRVDPNSKDASGKTPLLYAAERGDLKAMELLIEDDRVAADLEDISGRTPLSYIAEKAQPVYDKLSKAGFYDSGGKHKVYHPKWDAEELDCMRRLIRKMLAEKGVNPLFRDNSGRAPVDIMPELRQARRES